MPALRGGIRVSAKQQQEKKHGGNKHEGMFQHFYSRLIGLCDENDMIGQCARAIANRTDATFIRVIGSDGRAHILKIHARSMSVERDIRYELIARLCPNATGAELRSVCTEAGMFAIRARRKVFPHSSFSVIPRLPLKRTFWSL